MLPKEYRGSGPVEQQLVGVQHGVAPLPVHQVAGVPYYPHRSQNWIKSPFRRSPAWFLQVLVPGGDVPLSNEAAREGVPLCERLLSRRRWRWGLSLLKRWTHENGNLTNYIFPTLRTTSRLLLYFTICKESLSVDMNTNPW